MAALPRFDDYDITLAERSLASTELERGKGQGPHGLPGWVSRLDARYQNPDFEARYQRLSTLGCGGTSEVQLVRDSRIGRELAAKILRPGVRPGDALYARFALEACRQAQLEHPSIVPVHDIGLTETGQVYFTMKRVQGLTLAEILDQLRKGDSSARAKFSRRKILTAFSQVCLTIAFAHRRGVLHRDIKPGNIMLGEFGETYVLDWGLAKSADVPEPGLAALDEEHVPTPSTIGMIGTPGYMAPEQIEGPSERVGVAADIYGLGATLFEILALEPLHDFSLGVRGLLGSTLVGADARPSVRAPGRDVPPELEALCVRATSTDPAARFASVQELSDAIERFLDGDRDLALRQTLASVQSDLAAAELASARSAPPEEEEHHLARAMQAVGKALALDTRSRRAVRLLSTLLKEPSRVVPTRAAAVLAELTRRQTRTAQNRGLALHGILLSLLGLVACAGVRDWAFLISGAVTVVCMGLGVRALSRWERQPAWVHYVHVVLLDLVIVAVGRAVGPLFVMPMLLLVRTVAFAHTKDHALRAFSIGAGVLAAAAPPILERFGVLPSSYAFVDGAMCILPSVMPLRPESALLGLGAVNVLVLVVAGTYVGQMRDALRAAEERVVLGSWRLAQLVPGDASRRSR